MVAGNEGGDASNVVASLLRQPHCVLSYIRRRHFFLETTLSRWSRPCLLKAGSFDGRRMAGGCGRIRSYIDITTKTGSTLFCVASTHTRLIKQNTVLFDLDDGAGFIVHAIDKGVEHPVHDTYSLIWWE
jgi:hypothetical protein